MYHNHLDDNAKPVTLKNTSSLLTHNRFDLAFKLLYLELKEQKLQFIKDIYEEHIRAFSLGKFTEPGNGNKNNIDKFFDEFNSIYEDIKRHGFNNSKTLIPLSKRGYLLNGAHRVSSAIFLNKSVDTIKVDFVDPKFDYKFFYKRNVDGLILDIVATKFVEYAENTYIAFIWPIAQGKDEELENIIPNIVYRKNIYLNPNGAHNLISQIYYGEDWLGDIDNNFAGSIGKSKECFLNDSDVKVIVFQASSLDVVLMVKENVRKLFNVGKHSIHITDTKEEAIRVARVVFNDNGVHFLNYAKPNKYKSTHIKLDKFKSFIKENKINSSDVVLDSGMVLSLYGIREARDIDFLISDKFSKLKYQDKELECHDEELEYHDEEKNNIIYNPNYYFYFNEIKFISFNQLYRMKKNRAEKNKDIKDVNDYKIMEALVENNNLKQFKNKIKQKIYYGIIKLRAKVIILLRKLNLYNFIREIYIKVKEKK